MTVITRWHRLLLDCLYTILCGLDGGFRSIGTSPLTEIAPRFGVQTRELASRRHSCSY